MLYQILQQITDKRRPQGKIYSIDAILFITIVAIISGSKSYRDISIFTKIHLKIFKKHLNLNWKHAPSYCTIRNVVVNLQTHELERKFRLNAKLIHKQNSGEQICIDGKTVRGSFDKFKHKDSLQVLSAFFAEDLIVAGHRFFNKDKTNEIPELKKLIRELSLEDKFITADALHCQKLTVKQIKSQECNYAVQVKDNQPKLLIACQEICNSYNPFDIYRQRNIGHGRVENRYISVYSNSAVLSKHIPVGWRDYVKVILEVKRNIQHFEIKGKSYRRTSEVSYYVTTINDKASRLGNITRSHWYIENKLNYVKDVSMGEDSSRIRTKPENFVILRDWALNILRKNMPQNLYVKSQLFENSLNIHRVMLFNYLLC